jgi:cytochrome c oxidase subunit 2
MAITPPANKIWWNEPVERVEIGWIVVAFLWGLFMFFFMIAWHFIGGQNLSTETYKVSPAQFEEKVVAFTEKYQTGEEAGVPIVSPPAGEDVYLLARLWEWWPILELKKGQSYRFHLSSVDWQHGFSLQPVNVNVSVHPGYEQVITITPNATGEFGIACNEYCGIGHHQMTGRIRVID